MIVNAAIRHELLQEPEPLLAKGEWQSFPIRDSYEGGYLLARAADAITVGEVLRFIEGPAQGKGRQRRKVETPFTAMWNEVDQSISRILDHTTFADLLRDWSEKQNRFILNWEI